MKIYFFRMRGKKRSTLSFFFLEKIYFSFCENFLLSSANLREIFIVLIALVNDFNKTGISWAVNSRNISIKSSLKKKGA